MIVRVAAAVGWPGRWTWPRTSNKFQWSPSCLQKF